MVYGAGNYCVSRWHPSIRVNFHWDVLHLHIFLGLQDLLCVWIYVAGAGDPVHCYSLCYHRLYLLPSQRRRLQMAVDKLSVCSVNISLRLHVLLLLLFLQNKDVWLISDIILFWLHGCVQYCSGNHVWGRGLHGNKCLCEEDLHKCENWLETLQQCCGSADTSSRSKRAQSLHLFCKKRLWYLVQNLVFHSQWIKSCGMQHTQG